MAIADDLVGYAHIAYLGDPFEQYCGLNGKPLIGGWIEVYHAGTDTKYITMQNFDGAMNPFKIPLNADGRVVMLADPSLTYDIYVKNSYGDLVCSRLNVECTSPGNISISGADTRIKNTDGTLDVSLRTLGNNVREYTVNTNNKVLDLQEPLYFVENSNTATIIGVSGAGDPEVNDLVHANSATWNDVSAKLNTTAFSTVSGSFLTAHQSLYGYATTEDVESAVSNKLDTTAFSDVSGSFLTAHQDLSDYSTTAELAAKLDTSAFSDVSGTFLTAHQDLSQYATTEDLTAYQEKGDYYSASNPSGFLTDHQSLAGYLQDSDLTIIDNKITEISGVPLSAGDELPESVSAATDYITATSGDINSTINNVSTNSGAWGGSALPISAGNGISLSMVDGVLVISVTGGN